MVISNDIKYIGVNDHDIDLFEGQYAVPNGIAYNSYLILDEKIAVLDSVDADFAKEWLTNIRKEAGNRTPDYLIVQHMEPDHSANIAEFMKEFPKAKLVASAKAFAMMKQFFRTDFSVQGIVIGEGDRLSLGKHELVFFAAPMVHWPEVMVTYDKTSRILFSADAFGKFGALDVEDDWACEARRYYFGIVGKYGGPVQSLLKKLEALEIRQICPLHGPVLKDNPEYYINLYQIWSSYQPEEEGVVIAYTSVYGNTKKAVMFLEEALKRNGCKKVVVRDLIRGDMAEAVEDAFRYSKLILATTTYNGGVFPNMREFLSDLTEKGFSNRQVAFVENGSWAPMAAKTMQRMLEHSKNLVFAECPVKIMSAMNEESEAELEKLAKEFCNQSPKKTA